MSPVFGRKASIMESTLNKLDHLYPRVDDLVQPLAVGTETKSLVPLRIALQRAKEVYKKNGLSSLFEKIETRELTIFARRSERLISSECYEFNKSRPPIIHKDEHYRQRETLAYTLAFHLREKKHSVHAVHDGIESIFSFLDMERDTDLENSNITLRPGEQAINFRINEKISSIFFSSTLINSHKSIKESKYWRDITYRTYRCYDVSFDQLEIDRHFPYSQQYASKKPRGRTETYSQSELDAALDKVFSDVNVQPELREVMAAARDFYAEKAEDGPVEKTLRRKGQRWLANHKKTSGHK
ncbi:hypothetical protein AGR13a_Cc240022 [Agrobacterium genomosp. 13 str. CFBP 6927]|uniref:Uncharacterized protein n=1 Tax=Agrobacterium genomosp. 13 str. CFBP 6927 TaxID=1183428 RepID=A0ABP2BGD0_9HYPH|nr:hypothetical protein AGR13a_Cc240022 [Agrobacterium genomosp. 13 str. CFBP 6927]